MTREFLTALALLLVLEGIFPFASPGIWRRFMLRLASQDDAGLRLSGLIAMLVGVGLLYLVH